MKHVTKKDKDKFQEAALLRTPESLLHAKPDQAGKKQN